MSIELGWYVPTKKGYAGLYGRGDLQHYECTVGTFGAWQRRTAAEFQPIVVVSNRPASAQLEIA